MFLHEVTILTPLVKDGLRYTWAISFPKQGCSLNGHVTYARRRDAYRAAKKAFYKLIPMNINELP